MVRPDLHSVPAYQPAPRPRSAPLDVDWSAYMCPEPAVSVPTTACGGPDCTHPSHQLPGASQWVQDDAPDLLLARALSGALLTPEQLDRIRADLLDIPSTSQESAVTDTTAMTPSPSASSAQHPDYTGKVVLVERTDTAGTADDGAYLVLAATETQLWGHSVDHNGLNTPWGVHHQPRRMSLVGRGRYTVVAADRPHPWMLDALDTAEAEIRRVKAGGKPSHPEEVYEHAGRNLPRLRKVLTDAIDPKLRPGAVITAVDLRLSGQMSSDGMDAFAMAVGIPVPERKVERMPRKERAAAPVPPSGRGAVSSTTAAGRSPFGLAAEGAAPKPTAAAPVEEAAPQPILISAPHGVPVIVNSHAPNA